MHIETMLFMISLIICGIILYVLGQLWFVDTRNRKLRSLFVLGVTVFVWTLINAISFITATKYLPFILTLRMITLCIVPYSVTWFFLNYSASKLTQSKTVVFLLLFIPAIDILALVTNPLHLLYFTDYSRLNTSSGPLFWIHTVVAYIIILLAFIVMFRYTIRYAKEKPGLVWAAVGTLLPYVLNILFTLEAPGFTYDLTPFGFFVAFMTLAWVSYRARLLNVKTNAFANIFAALDNIILIADMDQTVVDFNQALNTYFPDFAAESGTTTINDFLKYLSPRIHSCSTDGLLNRISNVRGTQRIEGELELVTPRGAKTFTINRRVIYSGRRITGYVLALSDISEYRAMIAEIDEQNKRLTELKDMAESASIAKGTFLSNMSHEIRTPLNAVIGMIGIAKKSAGDMDRIQHCLASADGASKHLLGVINDILDMSKIEADKFELDYREFDFEKMLVNVTNVINFRAEEKKQNLIVNLDSGIPSHIIGDDLRLSQVITNLLSNAVKFTPENGTVILYVNKTEDTPGEVTLKITVYDNGIGISDEQQSRLFTSFEQADGAVARKFGGTGLGLAISKRIVEMMDGKIWIESELGHGSKFIFTIKARKGKKCVGVKLSDKISRDNLRILAVDDSPETRAYFEYIMDSFGLPCDVAPGGPEALDMVANCGDKPYNMFFIDWRMPDIDGVELTRRIKAIMGDNSVVIMISVSEWSIIEKDALAAGVKTFLPKPLFPSALINTINECLGAEPRQPGRKASYEGAGNSQDFHGYTILIAEDIEVNREIMSALLEPTGISIHFAENGQIAVSMFQSHPETYALILMDIQMPEMNGYEATREIRALDSARSKDIPIIAMTANVFREDIEECLAVGMNGHIGKPIDLNDVTSILEKWLPANQIEAAPISGENLQAEPHSETLRKAAQIGMDIDTALKRLGGMQDVLEQSIRQIAYSISARLQAMKDFLADSNLERFSIDAHGFRSSLASIGAMEFSALAAELETISDSKDHLQCVEKFDGFVSLMNGFAAELQHILPDSESPNTNRNQGESVFFLRKLEEIISHQENFETDKALACIEELFCFTYGDETDSLLAKAKRFIEKYEYNEAIQILRQIKNSDKTRAAL